MAGSVYEAKIMVEFTTGCTGDSKESAASNAATLLGEELRRAKIIDSDNPANGLFRANLISFTAEDIRADRTEGA